MPAVVTAPARLHDPWLSEFWPTRAPLRTTVSVTAALGLAAAPQPSSKREPRSNRSSFDSQREGAPLPDQPQTPTRDDESAFLDAYASTSADFSSSGSERSLSRSSGSAAATCSAASQSDAVAHVQPSTPSAHAAAPSEPHWTAAQPHSPASQALRCADTAATSEARSDGSACSTTTSLVRLCQFDSYADNVVVSLLCPRALSGHLIGRNGQTSSTLQVPGARWWLTDKAWKFGGAANLRCALAPLVLTC